MMTTSRLTSGMNLRSLGRFRCDRMERSRCRSRENCRRRGGLRCNSRKTLLPGYSIYKNVSPLSLSSNQGGHSVSGAVSLDHSLSEHFRAELGYQRLHNTYNGIAAITADPDADSAFISISYQLS